jgi:hypothetical protein
MLRLEFKKRNAASDMFRAVREDGSSTFGEMYRLPFVPHDMIHLAVESVLNLSGGFYGSIESGWNVEDYLIHEKRQQISSESMAAEFLAGMFQTMLTESADYAAFQEALHLTASARGILFPPVSPDDFQEIVKRIAQYAERWKALNAGETLHLTFDVPHRHAGKKSLVLS